MKYKTEKFNSLEECLRWVLDEKPVVFCGRTPTFSDDFDYKNMTVKTMDENWKFWEKAIKVRTETVTVDVYVTLGLCFKGISQISLKKPQGINKNYIKKALVTYEREMEE